MGLAWAFQLSRHTQESTDVVRQDGFLTSTRYGEAAHMHRVNFGGECLDH